MVRLKVFLLAVFHIGYVVGNSSNALFRQEDSAVNTSPSTRFKAQKEPNTKRFSSTWHGDASSRMLRQHNEDVPDRDVGVPQPTLAPVLVPDQGIVIPSQQPVRAPSDGDDLPTRNVGNGPSSPTSAPVLVIELAPVTIQTPLPTLLPTPLPTRSPTSPPTSSPSSAPSGGSDIGTRASSTWRSVLSHHCILITVSLALFFLLR